MANNAKSSALGAQEASALGTLTLREDLDIVHTRQNFTADFDLDPQPVMARLGEFVRE